MKCTLSFNNNSVFNRVPHPASQTAAENAACNKGTRGKWHLLTYNDTKSCNTSPLSVKCCVISGLACDLIVVKQFL